MSRGMDLLRRLASGDNRGDFFISNELLKEIEAILAQPEQAPSVKLPESEDEAVMMNLLSDNWLRHHAPHRLNQPEQEPVAWMNPEWRVFISEYSRKNNATHSPEKFSIPLYTAPPKREPLSDEEIYDRCCAMDSSYTCNFIDGVEWAEQQHGIGVDDE